MLWEELPWKRWNSSSSGFPLAPSNQTFQKSDKWADRHIGSPPRILPAPSPPTTATLAGSPRPPWKSPLHPSVPKPFPQGPAIRWRLRSRHDQVSRSFPASTPSGRPRRGRNQSLSKPSLLPSLRGPAEAPVEFRSLAFLRDRVGPLPQASLGPTTPPQKPALPRPHWRDKGDGKPSETLRVFFPTSPEASGPADPAAVPDLTSASFSPEKARHPEGPPADPRPHPAGTCSLNPPGQSTGKFHRFKHTLHPGFPFSCNPKRRSMIR